MGVEFVRMLTAAQRHQLVFNCPLCSLLPSDIVEIGAAPEGDAGGAIAAVVLGSAAVWGGYEVVTRVILNELLPEGAAIPANRGQLALLVWNSAGRPEPVIFISFLIKFTSSTSSPINSDNRIPRLIEQYYNSTCAYIIIIIAPHFSVKQLIHLIFF